MCARCVGPLIVLPPMSPNRAYKRLHKRKEILRVVRGGKRVRGRAFDLKVLQEEDETLRIAVVVPLLGENAVDRNRVKRRTREALRMGGFLGGVRGDIIVRAGREAYNLSYGEIVEALKSSFEKTKEERNQQG